MKINEVSSLQGMEKALSTSLSNDFEYENIEFGLVERFQVQPRLLTAMLGGEAADVRLETNTIKYDDMIETLQLPAGKRFEEFGPRLTKDVARAMIYEVGSHGLTYNVAPRDYANKRVPGSTDVMSEEYVMSKMIQKSARSWSAFEELAWAQLITTDTNINLGGSAAVPVYNYYTDIYGTTRPAAVDMQLSASADHFTLASDQYDVLSEELDRAGESMTTAVVLCGKNFFAKRLEIEKMEGLARDIRGNLDLASMAVPRGNFGAGNGVFTNQWFDSHDGFRYIKYSASILGTKIIGDEDAYVIPVGTENLFKFVYAPAQDRENVNTSAQKLYTWSRVSNRNGIYVAQETNVLPMTINPKLIQHWTSGD